MSFVVATLRETKRPVFINLSSVMTMLPQESTQGNYTEIELITGDVFEVTESPAELINGVM